MRFSLSRLTLPVLSMVVLACGGGADAPAPPPPPAEEPVPTQTASAGPDGATVYQTCATCHQADGKGMAPAFPPLAGSALLTGAPERPIAIVLHGFQGPIERGGVSYNGVMAKWDQLSDAEIAAALTYARSSWGNTAPAVTAEQVASVRAATAGQTTAWTEAELLAAKLTP